MIGNNMNEVSVIGLGAMGSTLAQVLLGNGYRVTVWNRTTAKAEPLVRDGAVLAQSAASAVGASPIVVVCVLDYKATNEILGTKEVASALAGRVLVQLTTGSPQEARDGEVWARERVPTTSMVPSWRIRARSGRTPPFSYRVPKPHSGGVSRFSRSLLGT